MSSLAYTRRNFLKAATLTSAGFLLPRRATAAVGKATKRKPNIVYVFADQLRAQSVGCYGGDQITTPNMDRIAQQGSRMDNCISTFPLCTPYRGMLLTGRQPMRNGCVSNTMPLLDGLPTIGSVCKANGYATGYIGKWHLEHHRDPFVAPNRRQGFETWAVRNCDHIYFDSFYCSDTPAHIPLPGWESAGQTGLAVDYIRQHKDAPFCLFVSWGPPHDPYIAPKEYYEKCPREKMRFRANVSERQQVADLLAGDDTQDARVLKERAKYRPILDNDDKLMEWWHGYHAATKSLDDCLGRIIDELDRQGIADDTILVFASDHGDMLGSHRMGSKQMPYEESIRVPFLLRYPRAVKAGVHSDALFAPIDIMPTLLTMAGLDVPSTVDGQDMGAAIRGEQHDQRDALLIMKMLPGGTPQFMNGVREWRGVRTKRHSYVRLMDTGPWFLFDNQADPLQVRNLVREDSARELCASMESKLASLMKEAGDPGDTAAIRQFAMRNIKARRETGDHPTGKAEVN